jgi:hypothetical protein
MIWKSLGWFNQWFKQWQSTSNNIEEICRNNSEISETGTVTFDLRSLKWVGTKNIVFYSGYHMPTKFLSLQKRYLTGSKDRDILQNNYDSRPSFTYDNLTTPHHKSRGHSYLQVYLKYTKEVYYLQQGAWYSPEHLWSTDMLTRLQPKNTPPQIGRALISATVSKYTTEVFNLKQGTWYSPEQLLFHCQAFQITIWLHPPQIERAPISANVSKSTTKSLTWSKERDILRTTMIHDKNIHITTWQ